MSLIDIPPDMFQGGANLSEGETKLADILAEHKAAIESGQDATSKAAADWPTGTMRIYAVRPIGNDASKGYADPVSSSSADYRAASTEAGAVALQTIAGLAAIFPRDGAGRIVEIQFENGTYTGSPSDFLSGCFGYAQPPIVRGTGTNPTAGILAFDGSNADAACAGGVIATGTNAGGYNPTASTNVQQTLQRAGGGSPSFGAIPALPLGLRVRFDVNTHTALLANVCHQVCNMIGADTLAEQTTLPATPATVGGGTPDLVYAEMPGVVFTGPASFQGTTPSVGVTFVGIYFNNGSGLNFASGRANFVFCRAASLSSATIDRMNTSQSYTHPVLGTITAGGGLRCEADSTISQGLYTFSGLLVAGQLRVSAARAISWGFGCVARSMMLINIFGRPTFDGQTLPDAGVLPSVTAGIPFLYGSGSLFIDSATEQLGAMMITGAGASAALSINGASKLVIDGIISGSAGNTDVGMSLMNSIGSLIILTVTPTVTGTAGDVRLAGGQIITWAQAMSGIIDSAGNRIIGVGNALGMTRFSGTLTAGAGATFTWLSDSIGGVNQTTRPGYPTSQRLITRLRVTVISGTNTNVVACTLYKNGVATAAQISIPAGPSAYSTIVDSTHPVFFADGDQLDLRLDDAADIGAIVNVSGCIEWAA